MMVSRIPVKGLRDRTQIQGPAICHPCPGHKGSLWIHSLRPTHQPLPDGYLQDLLAWPERRVGYISESHFHWKSCPIFLGNGYGQFSRLFLTSYYLTQGTQKGSLLCRSLLPELGNRFLRERKLTLPLTLCLVYFGVRARCLIDLWSDWAVRVSRWLPLSPDTLSGRVPLFYHSQSPALDQEELGLQKRGSQAHINKPSNPVLFHPSWGLWPQGKGSPGLWGQAAAAALKEHSFPEGAELSSFTHQARTTHYEAQQKSQLYCYGGMEQQNSISCLLSLGCCFPV